MSILAALDGGEPTDLASNLGWGDFGRWVDQLNPEIFPQLSHLRVYGWCQNLPKLAKELEEGLGLRSASGDVASTGKALLEVLTGTKAEVLTITDGLGPG
jgi:hypothetical protein